MGIYSQKFQRHFDSEEEFQKFLDDRKMPKPNDALDKPKRKISKREVKKNG